MGVSGSQAGYAAGLGKGWADPTDPNFGQPGYINQQDYDQYQATTGGAPVGSPASTGGASPITTAAQTTSTTAPVGGGTAAGQPTTVAQSFQQALVNRLNPAPVTASNPAIAPSIAANNQQASHQYALARNDLAEMNAADGTNNSGGMNSQILGLRSNLANQEGQFAGQAVQGLQAQQNQDLTSGLNLAGQVLTGQQSLAAQQALADQAASLQSQALTQQGQLGQGQLNLGLLSALLNNQQFGQNLSAQMGEFGAGLDSQDFLALLGGL